MGRTTRIVLFAVLAGLLPLSAPAHDSPEHVISYLTEQITNRTDTAYLLYLRAVEYRSLARPDRAAADLRAALKQRPDYVAAHTELSRVLLAKKDLRAALASTDRALELAGPDDDRPALHTLRAEIEIALGDHTRALADCQQAFAAGGGDVDSYLLRAQLQTQLGQFQASADGLEEGWKKTGSVVLEEEWIEALIDAGRAREALTLITPPLEQSRLRGAWLLRRARARLANNETAAGKEDLRTAVAEFDQRLQAPKPDVVLVVDRGLARALLGETESARRDLAQARILGADASSLWRLERALHQP